VASPPQPSQPLQPRSLSSSLPRVSTGNGGGKQQGWWTGEGISEVREDSDTVTRASAAPNGISEDRVSGSP
jgi:hypothetical protein